MVVDIALRLLVLGSNPRSIIGQLPRCAQTACKPNDYLELERCKNALWFRAAMVECHVEQGMSS
jgi:hypothetical protein